MLGLPTPTCPFSGSVTNSAALGTARHPVTPGTVPARPERALRTAQQGFLAAVAVVLSVDTFRPVETAQEGPSGSSRRQMARTVMGDQCAARLGVNSSASSAETISR